MSEQIYKQWVEEDKTEHTIYTSGWYPNEYHYKIVIIVPILNQKIQYVMLIDKEKLTNEDFIKKLSDEPKKRLIDSMTKKLTNFIHN
jgi:hypothetical protein